MYELRIIRIYEYQQNRFVYSHTFVIRTSHIFSIEISLKVASCVNIIVFCFTSSSKAKKLIITSVLFCIFSKSEKKSIFLLANINFLILSILSFKDIARSICVCGKGASGRNLLINCIKLCCIATTPKFIGAINSALFLGGSILNIER